MSGIEAATVIKLRTYVVSIMEESRRVTTTWNDAAKQFEHHYENLGWFIHFGGSHEKLFVGYERPCFEVNDPIQITIEKAPPTCPNPPASATSLSSESTASSTDNKPSPEAESQSISGGSK